MKRLLAFLLCAAALAPACLTAANSSSEDLRVPVGRSLVIDYPDDIARVSTSNPEIVDAVAVTTRELLIHAKGQGSATLVVWSRPGHRGFYSITVEQDLEPLRRLLKQTFPGEPIHVQAARDTVSLTGQVSSQAVADRATALAVPLAKAVVNNLQVAPAPVDKQILLRVRFAEINRNATDSLGMNIVSTGAANTPGVITTGQFAPPAATQLKGTIGGGLSGTSSTFTISDVLNIFAFRPDLNLGAFIKALQGEGVLQILAEPNLVTTNGKEASFLVGGEFPVPVVQGGANVGAVTIQFREFGIRLTFTPALTPNRTIRMHVKPEVSTIDLANGVTLSGFTIPALATRRMETNVELGEGQSFVIAGLLDDRANETLSRIPGLANLPILGALFKSRAESKSKTELLVMVTPEVVQPLLATDRKPLPEMPMKFLAPLTPAPEAATPGEKRKKK